MSLTNIFINDFLHHINTFRGVFSANEDVPILQDYESIIFNFSNKCEIGTHFIAIYRSNNKLMFFDPLCLFNTPNDILSFINKHYLPVQYNRIRIQDLFSDYCGYFCIAFILFITHHNNFDHFLDLFYTDFSKLFLNDVLVLKIIQTIISNKKMK
jgi:hypothetical protein